MSPTMTVTPSELRGRPDGGGPARLLDVRTPGEFAAGHIPNSYNIPLGDLDRYADSLAASGEELVVVCQSGARAGIAADLLRGRGGRATVLAGGVNAWQDAGGEVDAPGGAPWTIERQVRLVAGSLVASSILASLRYPKARFLAGGVGGGLVFAALSNTCLMGTLLAKLPHNRGGAADTDAAAAALTS